MFKKAEKTKTKLRMAIFGPSGSGKTYTALRMAKGMGGKVAVIDTEHGSASKYADRFDFDTAQPTDYTIDGYVQVIQEASKHGYNVLIIDSISHAWQQLIEEVEKIAQFKYRGNTWSAWSEGTPRQRKFVETILSAPLHIISTMRSKTAWDISKDKNGKTRPEKIGLAPEQGKGIEYEFDLLMEMSLDHIGFVSKDRTGKFQDKHIQKPGEDFGKELADWLGTGKEAASPPPEAPKPEAPPAQPPKKKDPEPFDVVATPVLDVECKTNSSGTDVWKISTTLGVFFTKDKDVAEHAQDGVIGRFPLRFRGKFNGAGQRMVEFVDADKPAEKFEEGKEAIARA